MPLVILLLSTGAYSFNLSYVQTKYDTPIRRQRSLPEAELPYSNKNSRLQTLWNCALGNPICQGEDISGGDGWT